MVRDCSQNSTGQGKAKRRELLPRVSSREPGISGAVAQTIRVGGILPSVEGFPGGKLRLRGSLRENFQEEVETQRESKRRAEMTMSGLRDKDRLDRASNFVIWKTRILSVFDRHRIKAFALRTVAILVE